MAMGFMLWTPTLIPKGCFINLEEGHKVVRCHGEEALERAKSLVNIQFSWYVVGVTIFALTLYFVMVKLYMEKIEYQSLSGFVLHDGENGGDDDVEAQKKINNNNRKIEEFQQGDHYKSFTSMNIER